MTSRTAWASVFVIAACGDNITLAPDAQVVDAPPPFMEAAHGNVPRLVSGGGIVLDAPKFKPIFFAGDFPMQTQVEQFGQMLAGSSYWHDTTSEYGVGDITLLPTLVTTAAVPATDTDLDAWLIAQLDGTHPTWGSPDQNTIYSVFLPAGAVLHSTLGDSCQAYGAYHDELVGAHGEHIVFALIPRCGSGMNQLVELTSSLSHELIEAATDPNVETTYAFGNVDDEHAVWGLTPGAETGDFCEYVDSAFQPLLGTYLVQRTWSNAAASAGHDPCVPQNSTYFSAAPLFTEDVMITGFNGQQITKGVQVTIGQPKTIDVALFSDAPTGDFLVEADDLASTFNGGRPELSFSWDKGFGRNGDTRHLTITRLRTGSFGGSEFVIVARTANATSLMWWSYAAN
ncbi:MAG: hypothetical protein JWO36_2766 [Myxococcales bacterium]|nr:hypothetical protein [Myxococcales bacterium]